MTNLISGKEALIALANGEDVEFYHNNCWSWVGEMIVIDHFISDKFKFRLKPRIIIFNGIEVPAPFEPKYGEIFWILSTNYECGYVQILCYRNDEQGERLSQFGAWRTESEIKQVVAALREVFKIAKD